MVRLLILVVLAAGCGRRSEPQGPEARRAFYVWCTTFALSPAEQQAIAALHVERIYLRVFDLGWADNAVATLGPVSGVGPVPAGVEIVPVVYIKAEVFKHLTLPQLPAVAGEAWRKVQDRAAALGFAVHELQLDCDWTDTTREGFFGFVRALKIAAGVPLSSTIGLHQVKYRERSSVPPVERGTLMFYNMGKFSADTDARMIFDAESAAKYLARVDDYPVPLDVALPIW